jgi:hypothetical protein
MMMMMVVPTVVLLYISFVNTFVLSRSTLVDLENSELAIMQQIKNEHYKVEQKEAANEKTSGDQSLTPPAASLPNPAHPRIFSSRNSRMLSSSLTTSAINDPRRVTSGTPPFDDELMSRGGSIRPAVTIQQLVLQMIETKRFTANDITAVMKTHRLSLSLCGSWIRAQGRPLDVHLLGTASLAVHFQQPLQAVLVMMVHSLALFAEVVQDDKLVTLTSDMLIKILRDDESGIDFTPEAIDIIAFWKQDKVHNGNSVQPEHIIIGGDASNNESVDRASSESRRLAADMIILEAINELDEYLSMYLVGFEIKPPQVSLEALHLLGAGSLAHALQDAQKQLEQLFEAAPQMWLAVAWNDPIPGQSAAWRHDVASAAEGVYSRASPSKVTGHAEAAYQFLVPLHPSNPRPRRKSTYSRGQQLRSVPKALTGAAR